jgi:hypothetical protein
MKSTFVAALVGIFLFAFDHIGFEVRNLEQFLRRPAASGAKFDVEYTKVPALNIAIAYFTDPWGSYIEVTEGLAE